MKFVCLVRVPLWRGLGGGLNFLTKKPFQNGKGFFMYLTIDVFCIFETINKKLSKL
jgi:hypothetical protein